MRRFGEDDNNKDDNATANDNDNNKDKASNDSGIALAMAKIMTVSSLNLLISLLMIVISGHSINHLAEKTKMTIRYQLDWFKEALLNPTLQG